MERFRYQHLRKLDQATRNILVSKAIREKQIKVWGGFEGQTSLTKAAPGAYDTQAITICEMLDGGELKAIGYAFCSQLDQFSRVKGRQIARGRAMKAFGNLSGTIRITGGK